MTPERLYHVSPRNRRAGISATGLDPTKTLEGARRVWAYDKRRVAEIHGGWSLPNPSDIWEIAVSPVDGWQHFLSGHWFTTELIPPERLTLHCHP